MKNALSILAISMLFFNLGTAQISIGIEGGISPMVNPKTNHIYINRENPLEEFAFNVNNVNGGISIGLIFEKKLEKIFFLNTKLLYNYHEVIYSIRPIIELAGRGSEAKMYTERNRQLSVPVSLGVHLGIFEFTSGFTTRFTLKNSNELSSLDSFVIQKSKVKFGFSFGTGINIGNINLSTNYQIEFCNYGSQMKFNEESLALLNSPSRFLFSVGYYFVR